MAWGVPLIGTVATVTSGNLTLNEPAGAAQGDLLIAMINYRSNAAFTMPSGWALCAPTQNTGDTVTSGGIASGMMCYIIRGASAPANVWTRTGGDLGNGVIVAYSGVDTSSPLDGTGTSNTLAVAATACTTASITTTQADSLIVSFNSCGDNFTASAFRATNPATSSTTVTDTTTAPTAGAWLRRLVSGTNTGADGALAFADAVRSTAGATGALLSTTSNTARSVSMAAAFKLATSVSDSVTLPTQVATATVGSVTALAVTIALLTTGVAGTGQVGAVTVRTDATVTLSTTLGTGQVGSVNAFGGIIVLPTGVAGTGQVNPPTVRTDVTVVLPTQLGTGQIGSVTAFGGISVSVTGVQGTGQLGSPTVRGDVTVVISTGIGSTASRGTLVVTPNTIAILPTRVGTTGLGNVTVRGDVTVILSGQAGTAALGSITVDEGVGVGGTQDVLIVVGSNTNIRTPTFTVGSTQTILPTGLVGTAGIGTVTVITAGGTQDVLIVVGPDTVISTPVFTITATIANVTGVSASGQIGAVTVVSATTANATPTGVAATAGSVDSVEQDNLLYVDGVAGTAAVGSVLTSLVAATVQVTGVQATASRGSVVIHADITIIPTGLAGLGRVGSPATLLNAALNVAPQGVAATGAVGSLAVRTDVTVSLVGVQATAIHSASGISVSLPPSNTPIGVAATSQLGTVVVKTDVTVVLIGLNSIASQGRPDIFDVQTIAVTGLAAATGLGTVVVRTDTQRNVAGVNALARIGNVTVITQQFDSITVGVTGQQATGSVGSVVTGIIVLDEENFTGLEAFALVGTVSVEVAGVANVTLQLEGLEAIGSVGITQYENDEGLAVVFECQGEIELGVYDCNITPIDPIYEFIDEVILFTGVTGQSAIAAIGSVGVVIGLEPDVNTAVASRGSLVIAYADSVDKLFMARAPGFIGRVTPGLVVDAPSQIGVIPAYMTHCPLNNKIYIAAVSIIVYDPVTATTVDDISLDFDDNPIGIRYSNYTQRLYVAAGNTLYTINPLTNLIEDRTDLGSGDLLAAVAINHFDQTVWVTSAQGSVFTYNAAVKTLGPSVNLGPQQLLGMEYIPTLQKMYISGLQTNLVYSIGSGFSSVAQLGGFLEPVGIGFCPTNSRIYVAEQSGRLSVINSIGTAIIAGVTGFQGEPIGVVFVPSNGRMFVSSFQPDGSCKVASVNVGTNSITGQV